MSVLVIIFLTAILVLFSGVHRQGRWSGIIGMLGLILAFRVSFLPEFPFWHRYHTMFLYSENTAIFTRISLMIMLLIFGLGDFALHRHRRHQSEVYALMLFALCGGVVLFGFQHLITLFLGIEILSIPLYVLAGSDKENSQSVEASVKYFLMGAFATGFLLLGFALIYGAVGSLDWEMVKAFSSKDNLFFKVGSFLVLSALGFKVAMVPFHFWSPDVYEGTPTLMTLFMASVVKIAGFFALFEVILGLSIETQYLWFFAVVSLIVPSVLGLVQSNVKRLLAYSSIANVGYMMLIFFGVDERSWEVLAFYLLAYSVASVGVFLGLIIVEKEQNSTDFSQFNGLAKSQPLLAVMMSIALFSLAGIPFTAGFMGKLGLFLQSIDDAPILVFVAVLASVVSVVYYLKIIVSMFFRPAEQSGNIVLPMSFRLMAVLVILFIIVLGVFPAVFDRLTP